MLIGYTDWVLVPYWCSVRTLRLEQKSPNVRARSLERISSPSLCLAVRGRDCFRLLALGITRRGPGLLCFFSGTLDWNAETGELWPLDWVTSVTVWTHAWLSCQEAKEEFNYELYTIVPNCGIASRMGTDLNPSSGSYWLWDCENTIFSLWASVSSFIKQE